MTLPAPAVAALRRIADETMTATVRLYTSTETHDPGSRPVVVWSPGRAMRGKLIPATAGGTNIRADQANPAGDWVLVVPEGTPMVEGQRATVEGEDRLQRPYRRAVLIKRVLIPRGAEITRRALTTEITGWWPNE